MLIEFTELIRDCTIDTARLVTEWFDEHESEDPMACTAFLRCFGGACHKTFSSSRITYIVTHCSGSGMAQNPSGHSGGLEFVILKMN